MTKTKPMTDEWKDSLLRYCDVFDTKDGSYLNEHNVINFIEELLHQATSKAREEERRRIKTNLIHNGWHETSCPAHSNNMGSESECDCLYSFVLESLKKDK